MEKINSFEQLLRSGAIFDVPDEGQPWILEAQDGEEICRGNSLLEMIENSPAENCISFFELDKGKLFVYLDEEYLKLNSRTGIRTCDQYYWTFKGDEEIFTK